MTSTGEEVAWASGGERGVGSCVCPWDLEVRMSSQVAALVRCEMCLTSEQSAL